jgi:hypothetical protein
VEFLNAGVDREKGSSLCLTHLGVQITQNFYPQITQITQIFFVGFFGEIIHRLRRLTQIFFWFFWGDREVAGWDVSFAMAVA